MRVVNWRKIFFEVKKIVLKLKEKEWKVNKRKYFDENEKVEMIEKDKKMKVREKENVWWRG